MTNHGNRVCATATFSGRNPRAARPPLALDSAAAEGVAHTHRSYRLHAARLAWALICYKFKRSRHKRCVKRHCTTQRIDTALHTYACLPVCARAGNVSTKRRLRARALYFWSARDQRRAHVLRARVLVIAHAHMSGGAPREKESCELLQRLHLFDTARTCRTARTARAAR
eukprot:IDg22014t1